MPCPAVPDSGRSGRTCCSLACLPPTELEVIKNEGGAIPATTGAVDIRSLPSPPPEDSLGADSARSPDRDPKRGGSIHPLLRRTVLDLARPRPKHVCSRLAHRCLRLLLALRSSRHFAHARSAVKQCPPLLEFPTTCSLPTTSRHFPRLAAHSSSSATRKTDSVPPARKSGSSRSQRHSTDRPTSVKQHGRTTIRLFPSARRNWRLWVWVA